MAIAYKITDFLIDRVKELERRDLRSSQYLKNRQITVSNVPLSIKDEDLSTKMCELFSLTGTEIKPSDIYKIHRLKTESNVIAEFKVRPKRDPIILGRKLLKDKKDELKLLGLEKVSINESMCQDYQKMDYICRKLKKDDILTDSILVFFWAPLRKKWGREVRDFSY